MSGDALQLFTLPGTAGVVSPMLMVLNRRLLEAALDQPHPTPALQQALNDVLVMISHPAAPNPPELPKLPTG